MKTSFVTAITHANSLSHIHTYALMHAHMNNSLQTYNSSLLVKEVSESANMHTLYTAENIKTPFVLAVLFLYTFSPSKINTTYTLLL